MNITERSATQNKAGASGKRQNRRSTRVDLTPIVDLGFLLVTFFVFTTTMATPKAMTIVVPNSSQLNNDLICETCVLTLLPDAKNKLYYYEGSGNNLNLKSTDYSANGIRKIIAAKKQQVNALRGANQMVLIIKTTRASSFKNMIDIIDEANINIIMRYYLDEPSTAETAAIAAFTNK